MFVPTLLDFNSTSTGTVAVVLPSTACPDRMLQRMLVGGITVKVDVSNDPSQLWS